MRDNAIDIDEAEEVRRILNRHIIWWTKMVNLSGNWDPEDGAMRGLS